MLLYINQLYYTNTVFSITAFLKVTETHCNICFHKSWEPLSFCTQMCCSAACLCTAQTRGNKGIFEEEKQCICQFSCNSRASVDQIKQQSGEDKMLLTVSPWAPSTCNKDSEQTSALLRSAKLKATTWTYGWESPGSCRRHAAFLDLSWHHKSMNGYLDSEAVWRLVLTSTKGPLTEPKKVSSSLENRKPSLCSSVLFF